MNNVRVYRWFRYFQQGFNLLNLPISLVSTATILYYLLIAKFSIFHYIFPEFVYFLTIGVLTFVPLSILIGWYYTSSKVYGSEMALLTEVNPLGVHNSRLQMEQQLEILKALNITPAPEYLRLTEFWRSLDDKKRWRP